MKPRHAKILINAAAGGEFDEIRRQRLSEIFAAAGATADIVATTPDEVGQAVQSAAKEDYDLFVAGGGDGTISLAASALVGTGKVLGILPLGTLSHFAKDLR